MTAAPVIVAGPWAPPVHGAAPLPGLDEVWTEPHPDGARVFGCRRVDADELYLRGHFPGLVVYPGVFYVETLVQAVLATYPAPAGVRPRLRLLRKARFTAPLLAGARLHLSASVRRAGARLLVDAVFRDDGGTRLARLRAEFDTASAPAADGPGDPAAAPPEHAGDVLDHAAITVLLPQRYPMLLVDRVEAAEPGVRLTAVKAVSAAEPCYRALAAGAGQRDHAYPASLLIESFGQSAALLWLLRDRVLDRPERHLPIFGGLRDVELHDDAYPGDVLRHEVRLDQVVDGAAFGEGQTWAGARLIATFGSLLALARPASALADAARLGAAG